MVTHTYLSWELVSEPKVDAQGAHHINIYKQSLQYICNIT